MGMCVIHGPRVLHQDGEEEEEQQQQQQQEEESLPRRDDHSSGFKPYCNNNAKGGGAVAVVEAKEREEEEERRNNDGSVGAPLEHHNQHPALWKRRILRGERCEPLAFSGLILYDEHGNRVGGNHMNRCYGARPSTCLRMNPGWSSQDISLPFSTP